MALNQEQFESLRSSLTQQKAGLGDDNFNKLRQELKSKKQVGLEQRSAQAAGALFPAKTGEGPVVAGAKAVGNLPGSVFNLARNIGQAVLNPIETVRGIGETAIGGVAALGRKLGTGAAVEQPKAEAEETFGAVTQALKERFGSLEALQRTATNDPFGFGADVAALITGGAGLAGRGGAISRARLVPEAKRTGVARRLREGAEEQITKALAPTTKATRAQAQRVVPELTERKVTAFSQEGLSRRAASELQVAADRLEDVLDTIPENTRVKTKPIIDSLEKSKEQFLVEGTKTIADPTAFKNITEMQAIIAELGGNVAFKSLRSLRQIWDRTVARSRKGFTTADERTLLGAKTEATNAIRRELAKKFPELAKVNSEFTLWKTTQDIIKQTIDRSKARGGRLSEKAARVGGQIVGAAAGGPVKSFFVGELARKLSQLFSSTAWRTVSARVKTKLAEAIVEGKTADVNKIISRILATQAIGGIARGRSR